MTNNQKRKIKRQAHKDFCKQIIRAYRILANSCDEIQLLRLTDTNAKSIKHEHHSSLLRINRVYRKTSEFEETSGRPFDDFTK